MTISRAFTDGQLAFLVAERVAGTEYRAIVKKLEKHYGIAVSADSIRRAFNVYSDLFETDQAVGSLKVLKEVARTKRTSSQAAKENRTILRSLNEQDDLMDQLRELVKSLPRTSPAKVKANKRNPKKPDITCEALISDVHVGKKTSTFDVEVCRERLKLFTTVLVQEIERKQAHYNVERIVLGFLGDNIENALMHGRESALSCEFDNPEQVRYAIELFWIEVLTPIAALGLPVDVLWIAGNHDRQEERPTFNDPGKNSLNWVIGHTLKMLADRSGMTNLTWHIPDGVYQVLEIYGDHILYEHGDRIKGDNSKKSFLAHLAKRSAQLGKMLKGLRLGHWHSFECYDNGTVIVNGSVPGQDSYADVNGYNSVPSQTITYYVRTKNRSSSYYYSFSVNLGSVSANTESRLGAAS